MHERMPFLQANAIGVNLFKGRSITTTEPSVPLPDYVQAGRNHLRLNPTSLSRAGTFLSALKDYCNSVTESRFNILDILPKRSCVDPVLRDAYRALERSSFHFKEVLTREHVHGLMSGYAAELVIAKSIREMTALFRQVPQTETPSLKEWNEDDYGKITKMDHGLMVVPVGKTNAIVNAHYSDATIEKLGEMDMIVETPTRSALFIDVSTSEKTVYNKLRKSKNDEKFSNFRRKISRLFQQTEERQGYRDARKVHIICSDEDMRPGSFDFELPMNGTLVCQVARRAHVRDLSNEIAYRLLENELLEYDSNSIGTLLELEDETELVEAPSLEHLPTDR